MNLSWDSDVINAVFEPEMSSFENISSTKSLDPKFTTVYQMKNFQSNLPLVNPYIAIYLIVIVSTSVLSNGVILLAMSVSKKKMRTFQLCLISVCVSDLLFSLCLHPMSIATALGYDAKSIFSDSGCLFFGTMALFFGTYDMVAHSLIAIIRYVNLCHPTRVNWVSKRSILTLLVASLVYSMVWCIGPAFGLGKYETFEVGCTMSFSDQSWSGRTFINCAFIFVFFLPLAVTVYSYVAIILEARRQRNILYNVGHVTTYGFSRLTIELKLVRLTSVIAAVYIVVWLPYAVVCLCDAYSYVKSIPWICRILVSLFCKTATVTNPLIYMSMSKSFRCEVFEAFSVICKCRNRRLFSHLQSSSSQKSSSRRSPSTSFRASCSSRIAVVRRKCNNTSLSSETTRTNSETHL